MNTKRVEEAVQAVQAGTDECTGVYEDDDNVAVCNVSIQRLKKYSVSAAK